MVQHIGCEHTDTDSDLLQSKHSVTVAIACEPGQTTQKTHGRAPERPCRPKLRIRINVANCTEALIDEASRIYLGARTEADPFLQVAHAARFSDIQVSHGDKFTLDWARSMCGLHQHHLLFFFFLLYTYTRGYLFAAAAK